MQTGDGRRETGDGGREGAPSAARLKRVGNLAGPSVELGTLRGRGVTGGLFPLAGRGGMMGFPSCKPRP